MNARLLAVARRALQKHGKTLRSVLLRRIRRRTGSGTWYKKAKTHKNTKSTARSRYVSMMLAAPKSSVVNKRIRRKRRNSKMDRTTTENVEVTVTGGQYLIRIRTTRQGCPLSSYLEVLESGGMEVLHVTTFTNEDRIFHTLIVESGMAAGHDSTQLQRRLSTVASKFSMKQCNTTQLQ